MAVRKQSKNKLTFFKNGEITAFDSLRFPLRGWIYCKGMSLSGVSPKAYNNISEVIAEAKALASSKKVTSVYFTVAEGSGTIEF